MHKIALLVACLACASHGRRVQMSSEPTMTKDARDPTNVLQASDPAAAFSGPVSTAPRPRPDVQPRPAVAQPGRLVNSRPVMHHIEGQSHGLPLQQQAADCLEEGCPVDQVEELVAALKASEKPSAELTKTIDELEKLLAEPEPNKNAISKLVAAVANSYTMPSDLISAFGEALSGPKGTPKGAALSGQKGKGSPLQPLAEECLEQGCPVDLVEELVAALKASGNPSAEITKTIDELEKLLVEPETNKNAISELVAAVANSYTMPSDLISAFGEALSGQKGTPKEQTVE